jgi:hypothetical protein
MVAEIVRQFLFGLGSTMNQAPADLSASACAMSKILLEYLGRCFVLCSK